MAQQAIKSWLRQLAHSNQTRLCATQNLPAFITETDFLLRLDKREPGAAVVLDVFNCALADSFCVRRAGPSTRGPHLKHW